MQEYPMCFACGRDNPVGLGMEFVWEGGVARASFTPRPEHQGWPGRLHGGLMCVLLDEAMAYALMAAGGEGYTGRLEVRFRGAAEIGKPLRIEARIERRKGRLVEIRASARDDREELVAEGVGHYMLREARLPAAGSSS